MDGQSDERAQGRASSTVSKKRYTALEAAYRAAAPSLRDACTQSDDALVAGVLAILRNVLSLDPSVSAYTPRQAASSRAWRDKKSIQARQAGTSLYEALGGKAAYALRKKAREALGGAQPAAGNAFYSGGRAIRDSRCEPMPSSPPPSSSAFFASVAVNLH